MLGATSKQEASEGRYEAVKNKTKRLLKEAVCVLMLKGGIEGEDWSSSPTHNGDFTNVLQNISFHG